MLECTWPVIFLFDFPSGENNTCSYRKATRESQPWLKTAYRVLTRYSAFVPVTVHAVTTGAARLILKISVGYFVNASM